MSNLNKTVAKFTYKKRKYEVDMLLDSKWASGAGNDGYVFDIFDVTEGKKGESVGQFDAYKGADYKKLAIDVIDVKEY